MSQNPIKLIEPLSVAFYFFIGEFIAVFISAKFGDIGKPLTEIIKEHIAPMSFYFIGGITLFISYIYSWFRYQDKPRDNRLINIFIIAPANFVITLGFVAIAVAWGEYLSMQWFTEFKFVPKDSYMPTIRQGALNISFQALALWCFLRIMYINISELKNPEHVINAKLAFKLCMFLMSICFASFWATIAFKVYEYFA
jgi:hypothetical protein